MATKKVITPVEETTTPEVTTTETNEVVVKTGVVANCAKLNVRAARSFKSKALAILNSGDKVTIESGDLSEEWVKICTAKGVKGYCVSKYITAVK